MRPATAAPSYLSQWVGRLSETTSRLASIPQAGHAAMTDLYARMMARDAAIKKAEEAEHRLLGRIPFFKGVHLNSKEDPKKSGGCFKKSEVPETSTTASSEVQDQNTLQPEPEFSVTEERNPFEVPKGSKAIACTEFVDVGDHGYINTFMMDNDGNEAMDQPAKKTLVICHGFGAGK
jgi:hypothetical protein